MSSLMKFKGKILHIEFKIGLVEIKGISIKVQFLVKKIQVFIKQTKK